MCDPLHSILLFTPFTNPPLVTRFVRNITLDLIIEKPSAWSPDAWSFALHLAIWFCLLIYFSVAIFIYEVCLDYVLHLVFRRKSYGIQGWMLPTLSSWHLCLRSVIRRYTTTENSSLMRNDTWSMLSRTFLAV